jgi:hypothetical protein
MSRARSIIDLPITELEDPSRDELSLICPSGQDWQPDRVLEYLGPALQPSETLIRLVVAAAVVEGPLRLNELAIQIERLGQLKIALLGNKLVDPHFEKYHLRLQCLISQLRPPQRHLQAARARLENSLNTQQIELLYFDVRVLLHFGQRALWAQIFSVARNAVGLEQLFGVYEAAPPMVECEEWCERLLPSGPLTRCMFFEPVDYDRLVIVYQDGLLAYDPLKNE